ncbi:hypothetical protein [Cellulosilyticum sp. I15G10I2]|uniref:hypothetical protein n=1 Tax=Cellulosilyticum sp. I15G10I2 TaxID=1892843 RepID=UPI00085BB11C|nr:hypothetical protein [Cellulosilyticum sp. I15G10I2]
MKRHKQLTLGMILLIFIFATTLFAVEVKPVAQFEFTKKEYQQKEPIEIIDTSYVGQGKKIVQKEWMVVINKKPKKGSNLSTLLNNIAPGQYEVALRVKSQEGKWSEQVSRKLTIIKNKPITITTFKMDKPMYAIGEKLGFIYAYDNPNELKIRSQKWTYKNLSTGAKIAGKPKYLTRTGKYEVSVQIQDEWGVWSAPKVCIVQVGTEKIERDGYYLFTKGKQGDLLEGYIDKDYNTFDNITNVTVTDKPGTLIVSNSPERILSSGILYKDTVSGQGRLLVHHQNAINVNKKLIIIATTHEDRDIKLSIANQSIKGPHKDILGMGQAALRDYFKGTSKKEYVIKAGQMVCIYDSALQKDWKKEDVISGLLDFESDGAVTFTVAALDYNSSLDNLSKLGVLKKDQHIRGTFDITERYYTIDATHISNPSKLVIGSQKEEWVTGKDALTGETVKNMGNYGVSVFVEIKNHEDMGIILNARGGAYRGAIKWHNGRVFDSPTEEVLSSKKIATLVGMVKANTPNQFVYMLPNGSSAPVLFGFVPQRFWK